MFLVGDISKIKTVEQFWHAHHKVCPYCKNEQEPGQEKVPHNGETVVLYTCSCGGKWLKYEPTEEDLIKFMQFVGRWHYETQDQNPDERSN